VVPVEFDGLGAAEIKRHPEIEVLLVTKDNRAEVAKKVPNWLRWMPSASASKVTQSGLVVTRSMVSQEGFSHSVVPVRYAP
jgi:hypothetical protein